MPNQLYELRCPSCHRTFFVQPRQWQAQMASAGKLAGCFVCLPGAPESPLPEGIARRVVLPLVALAADASSATRQLFAQAVAGSVYVLSTSGAMSLPWLYYEGGVNQGRDPQREPTLAERVEYALLAAGRALQHYPTRAKVALLDRTGINVVGYVAYDLDAQGQPVGHWVWWEDEPRPLWQAAETVAGVEHRIRQPPRRAANSRARAKEVRMAQKYLARWRWGKPELYTVEVEETPKTYLLREATPVVGFREHFWGQVLRKADLGRYSGQNDGEAMQIFAAFPDALAWLVEQATVYINRLSGQLGEAQQQRDRLTRMLNEQRAAEAALTGESNG